MKTSPQERQLRAVEARLQVEECWAKVEQKIPMNEFIRLSELWSDKALDNDASTLIACLNLVAAELAARQLEAEARS